MFMYRNILQAPKQLLNGTNPVYAFVDGVSHSKPGAVNKLES